MTWRVPPFDRAFTEAVAFAEATWAPLGVVVAGSIVRGEAGPTSDLDVHVVHTAPWRQRDQRRFAGVPAELFVNPAAQIRRYFADEHADGRPCTAHMFATGEIAIAHPVIDALVAEARAWLARPVEPTAEQLTGHRYAIVDTLDDARDVAATDPAAAHLLLSHAVERTIAYAFVARGRFQPRRKRAIADLADLDPVAGDLVGRWATARDADAVAAAAALARHVLGVDTFFAWTSARDAVEA